jgi:putative ABC transport system permease protein
VGTLWKDVKFGLRGLAKNPGFATVVILTLALGIGANTAIFSVVYGVLLRPLPYPQPDRIVSIQWTYKGQPEDNFDDHQFRFLLQHREPFEFFAADTPVGFDLAGGSQPERITALRVSSEYFHVLGVQPALGRDFSADEDRIGGPNVAILGYGLWKSNFGGDREILGKSIELDGTPFTVIGVMPAGFSNVPTPGAPNAGPADVWTTIAQVSKTIGSGGNYEVLARLKPGVTRQQAQSYAQIASAGLRAGFPKRYQSDLGVGVYPYLYSLSSDFRAPLLILFGAIGFVLLIACANVANLLMARAATRGQEIAIRTALGASRSRLFRQLLTESVLLSILGGALGLLLASWGMSLLLTLIPSSLPRAQDISLDRWALLFTILVSVLTGILFGLAPAFHSSLADLNEALKEGAARSSSGLGRKRLRSVLAVAEVALSLVLLVGATLLIETFAKLLQTNPGFDPHPILSLQIWTTSAKYNSMTAETSFYRKLLDQVRAIPGVEGAGVVAAGLPLTRGGNDGFHVAGANASEWYEADYREITPEYFRTMGIPLIQGRFFNEADSAEASKVAIVNQAFARWRFPGHNPIGEHLIQEKKPYEIVGVVGDVRSFLNEPAPPTFFVPVAQADYGTDQLFQGWFPTSIVVRTRENPLGLSRAVTDAIRSADPVLPVGRVQSMDQVLATSLSFQKFLMTLMSIFAGLALALAAVGIYGVMAYSVAQRVHEIGIRMALGARPRDILGMIVGQGMLLTLVGMAVGIVAAVELTRLLAGQLYGVKATDPLAFSVVVLVLAVIAFLACYFPARRAARVDPLVALRYE